MTDQELVDAIAKAAGWELGIDPAPVRKQLRTKEAVRLRRSVIHALWAHGWPNVRIAAAVEQHSATITYTIKQTLALVADDAEFRRAVGAARRELGAYPDRPPQQWEPPPPAPVERAAPRWSVPVPGGAV